MADADREGDRACGDDGVLDSGGGVTRDEPCNEGGFVTDTARDAAADPRRIDDGPLLRVRADRVAMPSSGPEDARHEASELACAVDVGPSGQLTPRATRGGSRTGLRGDRQEVPTFRFAVLHSRACADDGFGDVPCGRAGRAAEVHGPDACDGRGGAAGAVTLSSPDPRALNAPAQTADRRGAHR